MKRKSKSGNIVTNSFWNHDQIYYPFNIQASPTPNKLQIYGEQFVTEPKKTHLKMQSAHHEQSTALNDPFNWMTL